MGICFVYRARRAVALLLLLALIPCFASCADNSKKAGETLSDLLSLYGTPPAGQIFATGQEAANALDDSLVGALYARADGYLEYGGRVAEAAVYLGTSADSFFEVAVFVCYGNADTRAIVEMCHRRARLVASVHSFGTGEAVVAVNGRTVVMLLSRNTAAARHAVERLW